MEGIGEVVMLKFSLNRANVAFGCRHLGVEEDHCGGSRTV